MNKEDIILASAYLDGDVTPDERAHVEASRELLAEVEKMRLVRALVADAGPPSISVREEHLAAALAAWVRVPGAAAGDGGGGRDGGRDGRDATPSGRDPVAGAAVSTPISSSQQRPRRSRASVLTLSAAAAVTLVLAGGLVVRSISTGSQSDLSSSPASADAADAPAIEPDSSTALAEAAADELQQDLGTEDAVPDHPGHENDTDSATPGTVAASAEELGIDIDSAAPPQDDDLEVLSTPTELGIFASDALRAPPVAVTPDTIHIDDDVTGAPTGDLSEAEQALESFELPLCGGADFNVGPAMYQGLPVVVAVDQSRDLAIAYQITNCVEVARVTLP